VHCLDLAGRQLATEGSDAVLDERARRELRARVRDLEEQIVTWRIKSAIRKVGQAHPALGRHLVNAVRTGAACVYQPEQPLDWLL